MNPDVVELDKYGRCENCGDLVKEEDLQFVTNAKNLDELWCTECVHGK